MPPIQVPVFYHDTPIPGVMGEIQRDQDGRWRMTSRHIVLIDTPIEERIREVIGHGANQRYTPYSTGPNGIHYKRVQDPNPNGAAAGGAAAPAAGYGYGARHAAANPQYNDPQYLLPILLRLIDEARAEGNARVAAAAAAAAQGGAPAAAAGAGGGAAAGIYAAAPHVGRRVIPANAEAPIGIDLPEAGTEMANFHGEYDKGRVYTRAEFNGLARNLTGRKRNPMTRRLIEPRNVSYYTLANRTRRGSRSRSRSRKGSRSRSRSRNGSR